jgi:hypothetical protein
MIRGLIVAAALLLASCGDSDQDKLSGDLSSAEGIERDDPVIEADPDPDPQPAAPPQEVSDETLDAAVSEEASEPDEPPPMPQPSFDCDGSLNRVEALICTDPQLANLDVRLAREYRRALDEGTADQRERLTRLGRRYLSDRNRCQTHDCVLQSYRWYLRDIEMVMGWQRP